MDYSPLFCFLSEESVAAHKEYLYRLKAKYSILELSEPRLCGVPFEKIPELRGKADIFREAYIEKRLVDLHELYFDSFAARGRGCELLPSGFSSLSDLQYKLYCTAMDENRPVDFLTVLGNLRTGEVRFTTEREVFRYEKPLAAIDLAEHAYFNDYGFCREEYLKAAILHLNLSLISDFVKEWNKKRA